MAEIQDKQIQIQLVEAEKRKAAALESIAMQMPALIEALGKRGGGGWNRKPVEPKGTFRNIPAAENYSKGDMIRVVTNGYSATAERLYFYNGTQKISSIAYTSKTWERAFKEWKPTQDGNLHVFAARLLNLSLGEGDNNKKFWYVSGIEALPEDMQFDD